MPTTATRCSSKVRKNRVVIKVDSVDKVNDPIRTQLQVIARDLGLCLKFVNRKCDSDPHVEVYPRKRKKRRLDNNQLRNRGLVIADRLNFLLTNTAS